MQQFLDKLNISHLREGVVPFLAPMERTAEFSAVVKQFKLTDSGNAASKLATSPSSFIIKAVDMV